MQKLKQGLLFVFVGLPGLFLFLSSTLGIFFSFVFVHSTFPPRKPPVIYTIEIAIAGFLMLLGVGKLKQWRYLLVLVSFPLSLTLFDKISSIMGFGYKGYEWCVLIASLAVLFGVYTVIKRHDEKRSQSDNGMEKPAMEVEVGKRTPWIWVIFLFYTISAGYSLFSHIAAYAGFIPFRPAMQQYYETLSIFGIVLIILTSLANFAGAIALFSLRRAAYYLFTIGLGANIIGSIWIIVAKWKVLNTALIVFCLIGGIISFAITVAIWLYSWKLVKRGVLT